MSVADAAGCALSSSQSVSVVPTIQCRPHGITNSTDCLRAQDQAGVELQPVARDDEVDALGRAHLELPALADQVLDVVGPHAGGVDDLARADVDLLAAELVADAHAGDPLALAQEADHARVGGDGGARSPRRVRATVSVWRASSTLAS